MSVPRRLGWPFVITAALVFTCLLTLASMGRAGAPAFPVLHIRQNIAWLVWIVLAPGIIAVARRFPIGDGTAMRWLLRHLGTGAGFAVAAVLLTVAVRALLASLGHLPTTELTAPLVARLASGMLIYSLIAISYQALSYHGMARAREAAAAKLRADLAEARLAGIEGKLQPHFLFNALNSIAALMRIDPLRAEVMLEQLGELLRVSLRANPSQEASLEEVLHLAEQYLAIEQVRFQERLRVTVTASAAARRGLVPQLILQPLVENAVRHGIAPLEAGGTVTIGAVVENGTLLLTVEDDGVGFGNGAPGLAGSGLGLDAVRSVLASLYGASQRCEVGARLPRGTTATIALPYRALPV